MTTTTSVRPLVGFVHLRLLILIVASLVLSHGGSIHRAVRAEGSSCGPLINETQCENWKPGAPASEWDVSGAGDFGIQGFTTDISVNRGETVHFKISSETAYDIHIYRLGYYGGMGARKVGEILGLSGDVTQPPCLTEASTGLIDCDNWSESATWIAQENIGTTASPNFVPVPSGVYAAKLIRQGGGSSHILFIVRDDTRPADLLFQTSDTTWQAYNSYGGNNLYCGGPISNAGSAYAGSCATRSAKVSYNRPLDTRGSNPKSSFFNAEYPMLRWIEANGYSVKYWSGVDSERRGADLLGPAKPRVFLSVGHDEYWSGGQRANVEAARNTGVHLAFFSGNEVFWKTRWENEIDPATNAPRAAGPLSHRTLVSYKETLANAKIDPTPAWTGTWRDGRPINPEGAQAENGLTGTIWTVNCCSHFINVPEAYGKLRFWRNTAMATLQPGFSRQTPQNTLGYEWDEDLDNGFRPAGLIRLSSTTTDVFEKLQDNGSFVAPGFATHALTLYRHEVRDGSGNLTATALVFGAGTVQWSWGLDGYHDLGGADPLAGGATPSLDMQQATVNLFADMGVNATTLQAGLVTGAAPLDEVAPSTAILSPTDGSTVEVGQRVIIAGTALDTGGRVAGVEVSADNGASWRPAQGTSTWSFEWIPSGAGSTVIQARAIDDSVNVGSIATLTLNVLPSVCPCTSLWNPATTVPPVPDGGDGSAVELGVRFYSETAGFVTGVRFYKSGLNTGTHVAHLWTTTGALLASATFMNETPEGWQEVSFASPIAVNANTHYIASYFTPTGHYSYGAAYFNGLGVNSPPLHAPENTPSTPNGVYFAGAPGFPNNPGNANYWVDVVFAPPPADTIPPAISNVTAFALTSSTALVTWTTDELARTTVFYGTSPNSLDRTVADAAFVSAHSATLTGLTPNIPNYYRVVSTDLAGNTSTSPPTSEPPASFTPPLLQSFLDTTAADFTAPGTEADGTYVAQMSDGEVILRPTVEGFDAPELGPALPSDWASPIVFNVGGSAEVVRPDPLNPSNGVLRINGAMVKRQGNYGPGRSLEFLATFGRDMFQHSGFAVNFNTGEPWAIFSTAGTDNTLWVRTNTGTGGLRDEPISVPNLLGFPHRYRIDWNTDGFVYYVDGVQVASHAIPVAGPMQMLAASDLDDLGGGAVNAEFLDIDSILIRGPFTATSGTFVSRVFDAGSRVDWYNVNWTSVAPGGTSLTIDVRAGDTNPPTDAWTSVNAPGVPLSTMVGRYMQYRASLNTGNVDVSPELRDITLNHVTGTANSNPIAGDDTQSTPEDTPLSGSVALLASDPDSGDTLIFAAESLPSQGTLALMSGGSYVYTPAANFFGPDGFTYRVSDGHGGSAVGTVTINVLPINDGPFAQDDGAFSVNENSTLIVPVPGVLANDSDVDSDPSSMTALLYSGPTHGSVVLNANGSFTYTPAPNYSGPDGFFYQASDGQAAGNVAGVSILVNAVNDAPIARADEYVALKNPVGGDPVTGNPVSLTIAAPGLLANDTDPDTNPMSVVLVSQPSNGTLTLSLNPASDPFFADQPNGGFTYTPNVGFLGTDSFTYYARDPFSAVSSTVTVTISVVEQIVTQLVTTEDVGTQPYTVVSTGDTYAGSFTTTTDTTPTGTVPVVTAVTTPIAGTVTIGLGNPDAGLSTSYTFLGQQVNISAPIATPENPLALTFLVDASLIPEGYDYATLQIFRNGVLVPDCPGATTAPSDPNNPACISARIALVDGDAQITVLTSLASRWLTALVRPVARPDAYTATEDIPLTIAAPGVLANDDPDDGFAIDATLWNAVSAGTGTLDFGADGGFTFTPAPGYCGNAYFSYQAHSGGKNSNIVTVTIAVACVNDPPEAADGALSTAEDTAASGTLQAVDSDSSSLTFSVVSSGSKGTAVVTDATTGAFTYTPNLDENGTDAFTFKANDGTADSNVATVIVTINPVNDAPVANNQGIATNEDTPLAIALTASDVDSAALTYTVVDGPASGVLSGTAPNLTYTPNANFNGGDSFTFKVNDGSLDSNIATISIAVAAVNDAPAATGSSVVTNEDTAAGGTLQAVDSDSSSLTYSIVSSGSKGTAVVTDATTGAFTYTPNPNATGPDAFTFKANDGTADSNVATVTVTINPVNDAPGFIGGPNQTVLANSGSQTVNFWATGISAGPADEAGQMVGFLVSTTNAALFSAAPAVSSTGTLTYTPAPNQTGTATVNVQALDSGGTANGGVNTSGIYTFTIAVNPSGTLLVTFKVHAVLDTTNRPRVSSLPLPNAEVRVYIKKDPCPNGLIVSGKPKIWGQIFDGLDGPGGADPGCAFFASGVTDASGSVNIVVPPTSTDPNSDYIVIARSMGGDGTLEPIYSQKTLPSVKAGDQKKVLLHELRTYSGKRIPGRDLEEYGSYLAIVQPEYMDWTTDEEYYPIVLVAEGDWELTTSITPPDGFVSDTDALSTTVVDETSAIQFVVTDIGSDWTASIFDHTIRHKGQVKQRRDAVPMFNHKPTRAKPDFRTVVHGPGSNASPVVIDVMHNDDRPYGKTVSIRGVGEAAGGTVTLNGDEVVYVPNPGFSGTDTFTYTIVDNEGVESTTTVTTVVATTPDVSIGDASTAEGDSGTTSAAFSVTLSGPFPMPVTVDYSTIDGTALAGADFVGTSGTLTFAAGEIGKSIPVSILGNTLSQSNRAFVVRLTNAVNAVLNKSDGAGTIVDDDPAPWTTSSLAQLLEGTTEAGSYVSQTGDGELILAPTVGAEFFGTALPTDWTSTALSVSGNTTVADGQAIVDGASLVAPNLYGSGRTLEFVATFSGDANQSAGFGLTSALLPPFAMFGTKTDGLFYARSVSPGNVIETAIPGAWFGTPHRFRIDWTAKTVAYSIDGVQVALHALTYNGRTGSMRPAASDLSVGSPLKIDWMRMTPYASSGTYTSTVFDAETQVEWLSASWTAEIPAGTTVVVSYRTGNTATPDGTWTPYEVIANPGNTLTGSGRYIQFRVQLGTTVPTQTPVVKDLTFLHAR